MRYPSVVVFAMLVLGLSAQAQVQAPARASDPQALRAEVAATRVQAAAARAALPRVRAGLQATGLPPLAVRRHEQFQQGLERRAAEFERSAAAWEAEPSEARRAELHRVLEQHKAADRPTRALSGKLPWGPARSKRLPAETKGAWWNKLTSDQRIQLAQAGGLTSVGGVRFSNLPAAGEEPADADLAETAEIQLTPAIRAKAAELGQNPVEIANWVRRNVRFVPTWGATQTAEAVLRGGHGNAVDTASLTIALLRASGI
ncbi:MAG TPA: transglutaminase-like domain-containing protein, partial [Ramlibacter sp.]